MQLVDFFDRGAELWPDRACFHDGEVATSYRAASDTSHRIANGLTPGGGGGPPSAFGAGARLPKCSSQK